MNRHFLAAVIACTTLTASAQTYVSWTLGTSYELNSALVSTAGIQLKTTATFGYGKGVSSSSQTISSGQEIQIRVNYDASQYLMVGLHPTVPTAISGNTAVKYAVALGNNGSGNGIQPYESGALVAGKYQTLGLFGWFRLKYSGTSIIYSKSADGVTWTDFYTSPTAASGTYKVIFDGASPGGYIQAAVIAGTATTTTTTTTTVTTTNTAPVANAGADISITSPTSSASLSGSGTDVNGTITAYAWSQVSGPNTAIFANSAAAATTASGLIAGTYVFRLKVTDNAAATATDDMSVFVTASGSTSFSYTALSTTGSELRGPMKGAYRWNGMLWDNVNAVMVPSLNMASDNSTEDYARIPWLYFEKGAQGTFDFSYFDYWVNLCITNNKKFSFRIDTYLPGTGPFVGTGFCSYPLYLHNQMQTESAKDWVYGNDWVPNWNSTYYLSAIERLCQAINTHINTTSYNGRAYKDVIGFIDISGYGNYGEWHTYPWHNNTPAAQKATSTSLKRIFDAFKNGFPNYQLVIPNDALDNRNAAFIPLDAIYYFLTAANTYGQIGIRVDHLGDPLMEGNLANNPDSYNGVSFGTLILNKYKFAPFTGEPINDWYSATSSNTKTAYWALPAQVQKYHIMGFGNGNYWSVSGAGLFSTPLFNNIISASKLCGYNLVLSTSKISPASPGKAFSITLNWRNTGVAPTYENWQPVYELRSASNAVVWSGNSAFKPRLFLPRTTDSTVVDNFTLPTNLATGSYGLYLVVRDPSGYRAPLPLGISGVKTDGSYLLGNVTVSLTAARAPFNGSVETDTDPASLGASGKFSAYPIPVKHGNDLFLTTPSDRTATVVITNALGQTMTKTVVTGTTRVSTHGWTPGMYLVQFLGSDRPLVRKVIVE